MKCEYKLISTSLKTGIISHIYKNFVSKLDEPHIFYYIIIESVSTHYE